MGGHIMELDELGLPAEREPIDVGAVRMGGSELRVRIIDAEHGPKIDVREYVLPRRPEDSRIYVPKGKGRGKAQREPYTGWTKHGIRLDVETMGTIVALIVGAMAQAEDEGMVSTWEPTPTGS